MKSLVFGLLLSFSVSSIANTLICEPKPYSENSGRGVIDTLKAECKELESENSYDVEMKTYGISFRFAGIQSFAVNCPLRSGDELLGKYYGIKAEAEVVLGAKLAYFANSTSLCSIIGLQAVGIGAGVTAGEMFISKNSY